MTIKKEQKKPSREKYAEFKMLRQQLEYIQKYKDELETKQAEFLLAKESLRELQQAKPGSEAFVPVAQGIFAKANLSNTSELLINVGADIAVTKTVPQCIDLLEKQASEVSEILQQLDETAEKITAQMNILLEELQASS